MTLATHPTHDTYRREARRVRARLRHRPAQMHAALQALARQADQCRARPLATAPPAPVTIARRSDAGPIDAVAEQAFAQLVRRHVTGPVLRYSIRRDLLARAAGLGIGRFHANLIIATVQHERRHLVDPDPAPDGGIVLPLIVVAGLQLILLAAAWWLVA